MGLHVGLQGLQGLHVFCNESGKAAHWRANSQPAGARARTTAASAVAAARRSGAESTVRGHLFCADWVFACCFCSILYLEPKRVIRSIIPRQADRPFTCLLANSFSRCLSKLPATLAPPFVPGMLLGGAQSMGCQEARTLNSDG